MSSETCYNHCQCDAYAVNAGPELINSITVFVRSTLLCSTWAAALLNFNIKYEISDFTRAKCSPFKKEETDDGLLSCGASAAARRPFVEAEPKAVRGRNGIFHFDGR